MGKRKRDKINLTSLFFSDKGGCLKSIFKYETALSCIGSAQMQDVTRSDNRVARTDNDDTLRRFSEAFE